MNVNCTCGGLNCAICNPTPPDASAADHAIMKRVMRFLCGANRSDLAKDLDAAISVLTAQLARAEADVIALREAVIVQRDRANENERKLREAEERIAEIQQRDEDLAYVMRTTE